MTAAAQEALPATLPQPWRQHVELGFSVIPVEERGKLPLGRWKPFQHARASVETIAQWAARPSNIGIVTGAVSGLLVLDLDSAEAVAEAERRGLPDTITVTTAKGLHVYFRHPGGEIGNRAGLLPGMDIRGDGGFIVAPGSIHPSGAAYEWQHPPGLFELAAPPQWLLDLLAKPERIVTQNAQQSRAAESAYGERAIDNELSALRRANEGERNDALNRAAFNLAQLAAGGVIGEEATKAHLRATAAAIGLDGSEIEATLESGWNAGSEHPRRPEPRHDNRTAQFQSGAAWRESFDPETGEITDEPPLLPLIDIAAWQGDPPPRRSLWGDWLPVHQTTMLTGPGGVGKSLLEQCLCTAVALGETFLGMETTQRSALYVTCEDDADELWRRQDAICAMFGAERGDLVGKLFLASLTGAEETALVIENDKGLLDTTPRWRQLERTCQEHEIGLYAFDNATDALAGDHNSIHVVAAFVNLLTGLAIRQDGVAMILHHPNKKGDDWLGSVAWHNKVRSRLIIEEGGEADPDARAILNPKANYGPSGGRIPFRWHRGAFLRDEDLPADYAKELTESIRVSGENEAFLRCLRARMATPGREVGPNLGPNYAPARFAEMTEAKGTPKAKLARAMERLLHTGAIETKQIKRKGSDTKTIIAETLPNGSDVLPNRPSEPLPQTASEPVRTSVRTVPRTDPSTTYITGAAHEAAAPDGEEGEEAR